MKDYYIHDVEAEKLIRIRAENEERALIDYLKMLTPEIEPEGYAIAINDFNGYVLDDVKDLSDF